MNAKLTWKFAPGRSFSSSENFVFRFRVSTVPQRVDCCVQPLKSWDAFVTPWTAVHQLPLPRNSPGKTTRGSCHLLLQGNFLTQRWNPHLLLWLVGILPTEPPGKPTENGYFQVNSSEWLRIRCTGILFIFVFSMGTIWALAYHKTLGSFESIIIREKAQVEPRSPVNPLTACPQEPSGQNRGNQNNSSLPSSRAQVSKEEKKIFFFFYRGFTTKFSPWLSNTFSALSRLRWIVLRASQKESQINCNKFEKKPK